MDFFVGIDWGSREHAACVVGASGEVVRAGTFEHTPKGLQELVEWIVEHATERALVGLEVPRGPVVETLLERGLSVFALNPKQLDRFRDRFSASGAKDDPRDARVLADSLRTDRRAFRQVCASAAWLVELRELSRMRDDLVRERVALCNGIRSQLGRYFPQMLEVIEAIDDDWAMQLLDLAPTPQRARALPRAKLQNVMRRVRRISVDEAREKLRGPGFHVAPGTIEAASRHMQMLLRRLVLIVGELRECDASIEAALTPTSEAAAESEDQSPGQKNEQRDVRVLQSLPGVGSTILATLLAEALEPLSERNYHALRLLSGVAPVTKRSGKQHLVVRRLACNKRLADAVYQWARCATQRDPLSKAKYAELRRRGHSHGRALRTVADRLLSVACAMLQSGETFRQQAA
jgi:transposase